MELVLIKLEQSLLGHNKFGYYNFGYLNFSHEIRKNILDLATFQRRANITNISYQS